MIPTEVTPQVRAQKEPRFWWIIEDITPPGEQKLPMKDLYGEILCVNIYAPSKINMAGWKITIFHQEIGEHK